jgi:hypothetical protein
MEFGEEEALLAADNCEDVYAATKFLRQECELCANVINVTEVKNRQRDREAERQGNRETEKQRNRETEKQRNRETEKQRNRETEKQRNRETEK